MFLCSPQIKLHSHKVLLLVDGQSITLEYRQFIALRTLMENAGQVVSKDQMIENLWQDRIVSEGSLFKAIANLRKTLKDLHLDDDLIRTIHGQGYMFTADVAEIPEDQEKVTQVQEETIQPPFEEEFVSTNNTEQSVPIHRKTRKKWLYTFVAMSLFFVFLIIPNWQQTEQPQFASESVAPAKPTAIEHPAQVRKFLRKDPELAINLLNKYLINKDISLDDELEARNLISQALNDNGRYPEALEQLKILVSLSTQNKQLEKAAAAFHMMGDAEQSLNNIESSRKYYDQAVELYLAQQQENKAGFTLIAKASMEMWAGEQTMVLPLFERVREITKSHPNDKLEFRLALEKGTYYSRSGQMSKALQSYDLAFDIAIKFEDKTYATMVMNNAAIGLQMAGKYAQAANRIWKAIQLFPAVEKHHHLAILHNTIGNTAMTAADMETAESFWLKSLQLAPDALQDRFKQSILLTRCMGLYATGDLIQAHLVGKEYISLFNDEQPSDSTAQVYAFLALIENKNENPLAALEYSQLALSKRTPSDDIEVDFYTALAFGEAYLSLENTKDASLWLDKAEEYSKELNLPTMIELYSEREKLALIQNNNTSSLYYQELKEQKLNSYHIAKQDFLVWSLQHK